MSLEWHMLSVLRRYPERDPKETLNDILECESSRLNSLQKELERLEMIHRNLDFVTKEDIEAFDYMKHEQERIIKECQVLRRDEDAP